MEGEPLGERAELVSATPDAITLEGDGVPPGEQSDQLLVVSIQVIGAGELFNSEIVQVHSLLLGHHVSHQVLPP